MKNLLVRFWKKVTTKLWDFYRVSCLVLLTVLTWGGAYAITLLMGFDNEDQPGPTVVTFMLITVWLVPYLLSGKRSENRQDFHTEEAKPV